MESITVGSIDSHLHSEVQLITAMVELDDGKVKVDLHEIAVGDYAVPLSGHYFQVMEGKPGSARVVACSASLEYVDARLPFDELHFEGLYKTIDGPAKKPLRLGQQSFIVDGQVITILASESLKDTQVLLASYKNTLFLILPAVFFISAVVVFFLARFSLSSLNLFTAKVGAITEQNLGDRLDEKGLPSELRPLAENFNAMLSRLEESFETQRRFLSDASHQLRTPVAVIKGYCDVTLGSVRDGKEYRKSLEKINDAAVRMTAIIERILESSRAEARHDFKELYLMAVVSDAVRLLQAKAAERGVMISVKGDSLVVSGDRVRLIEAVSNLVDNALKYNHQGGEVLIEVVAVSDYAVVTIDDTGVGIVESARERIFERFYRSDETSAEVAGSGLALSIVQAIVAAHGGSVEAGVSPFGGSRFRFCIPLK